MKNLGIKRIKIDFKDDWAVFPISEIIENEILNLEEAYPEKEFSFEKDLISITGEYLYLTFTSFDKETPDLEFSWH